jgi:hypothetical protein
LIISRRQAKAEGTCQLIISSQASKSGEHLKSAREVVRDRTVAATSVQNWAFQNPPFLRFETATSARSTSLLTQ